MRAVAIALLLSGLSALAGCVLPPDAPEAADLTPAEDASSRAAPTRAPPAAPTRTIPPALTVDVADRWVRPGDPVNATAIAVPAAPIEWYLVSRNPIPHTHVLPLALSVPAEGAASAALDLEGRVRLVERDGGPGGAGGAALNITLDPRAPAARVVVIAREDAGVWRLDPEEVVAGPGSRLVVHNTADRPLALKEVERLAPLGGGATLSFTMPEGLELGDYDLVALARADDGGVAEAAARLVYDRRKPERTFETPAFVGGFDAAATSASARHAWATRHDALFVDVVIESTSDAPLPHAIRVVLLAANGTELASGSSPGFSAGRVVAGEHTVRVLAEEGIAIQYAIRLRGTWDLVTPDSFFAT